jgi:hypothetical protein
MTLSERATAGIREIPQRDRPISEQYRVMAKMWVEAEKAACMLEETKSAVLSQLMIAEGDMPVSKAEMRVKGSPAWRNHLTAMVEARSDANLRKVHLEYIRMQFSEWQAGDANQRSERRMSK